MAENEYVFDDSDMAMRPSRMKVTKLSGDEGRWHFAIDPIDHPKDSMHVAALTISAKDAAELMRNLAPFVPEVEPVAWMDPDGSLWYFDEGTLRNTLLPSPPLSRTIAEANEKHGPLTALYAHPPVTAEPAEWEKELLRDHDRDRAEKAEARVRELREESERRGEYRDKALVTIRDLRADVERYKAALEERDELIQAQELHHLAYVAFTSEKDRLGKNLVAASKRLDAARAAVETETSEEAGDE